MRRLLAGAAMSRYEGCIVVKKRPAFPGEALLRATAAGLDSVAAVVFARFVWGVIHGF